MLTQIQLDPMIIIFAEVNQPNQGVTAGRRVKGEPSREVEVAIVEFL